MKSCLSRYRKAFVLLALLLPSFCFAETLTEFTTRCEIELQMEPNSIKGFDCSTGTVLPTTEFGNACDAQALLGGPGCTANSRLGVQTYANKNVKAVWVCRKYAGRDIPDDQRYYDIAMIVHNRQNGKTCFFQNNLDNTSDGPIVPSPKAANALSVWGTPQATVRADCTSCHVNDPYIVTPHVARAMGLHNMIRFNPKGAYSVVGSDFSSPISRTEGCGGICHFEPAVNFVLDANSKQWMLPGTLPNYTAYHFNPLSGQFYSLGSNGEIRGFNGLDGGSCNFNVSSCPHWSLLGNDPNTRSIAASRHRLYRLQDSGQIYQFKGVQCGSSGSCPSWELLDNNPRTEQIVSGNGVLYQRWNNGAIWMSPGSPCAGDNCGGWQQLDNNSATVEIVAAGISLYKRHFNGDVYRYTGTTCSGNVCTGWRKIANDASTIRLVADDFYLYRQQQSGAIWQYTNTPCDASGCSGWKLLDSGSPNTKQVVAGGSKLYRLYNNGEIWRYSGSGQTWTMLDNNPNNKEIVASRNGLLKRQSDGLVWRFIDIVCNNGACLGWTPIEKFSNTESLTGSRQ